LNLNLQAVFHFSFNSFVLRAGLHEANPARSVKIVNICKVAIIRGLNKYQKPKLHIVGYRF